MWGSERRITDDFRVIDPGLLWAWGYFDRSQEILRGEPDDLGFRRGEFEVIRMMLVAPWLCTST